MKILTGIDLPFLPSCGSMLLCSDLYENTNTHFLSLQSNNQSNEWHKFPELTLFDIEKETREENYERYLNLLYNEVKNIIIKVNPDIIHIQHLTFGLAKIFIKFPKIPKIAICHGTDILFAQTSQFHLNTMIDVYNNVSHIVFPTCEMKIMFEEMTGCKEKSVIIPWGIPIQKIVSYQKNRVLSKDRINLLFAGRLTYNKNPQMLITLLEKLPERFNLTIVGNGEAEDNLKFLSMKSIIKNRLTFQPFISRDKLWEQMNHFDLLLIPTKNVEAFCLTAIEAQILGLPVACTNVGGLKNVIGSSGIMFNLNDIDDLVKNILNLFDDNEKYNNLVNKSVKNALKYNISETRKIFIKLSEKLLKDENV